MARSRPPITFKMLWAMLPLGLIALRGPMALLAVVGAVATGINLGVMNRDWPARKRYGIVALITLAAYAAWFALSRIPR